MISKKTSIDMARFSAKMNRVRLDAGMKTEDHTGLRGTGERLRERQRARLNRKLAVFLTRFAREGGSERR